MVKILGRSGTSLSDVYDVQGSRAGPNELSAQEVQTVHEMGGTIFSERLSGRIFRMTSGSILQTVAWNIVLPTVTAGPSRILGVVVFADLFRVSNATVSIRDVTEEREIPIFIWDVSTGDGVTARLVDDGAAVAAVNVLQSNLSQPNPSMLIGTNQPRPVDALVFRGLSTTFGAGNVVVTALIYVGFPIEGGINSDGLPIPSW